VSQVVSQAAFQVVLEAEVEQLEWLALVGCNPAYPSVLNGEEGRAVVRVELDSNGNVVDTKSQPAAAVTNSIKKHSKPQGG
jgi:hypothetical protein